MSDIVVLSGSPSEHSRSEHILKYLGNLLEDGQFTVAHLSVRDVSPTDVFQARFDSPDIKNIVSLIQQAKGLIVGSPVYNTSYSGVLKAVIDLFPEDIFEQKPVLPVMTGGSPNHLLAIEYSLKPLLSSLKGECTKGLYFIDDLIDRESDVPVKDEELIHRMEQQLDYFMEKVKLHQNIYSNS